MTIQYVPNPQTGVLDIISVDAPTDATYITLSTNATLSNERVATASSNISITDAGAGSTATFDLTDTSVSPGSYTYATLTVDAKGRITSASSGATPAPTTASYLTLATNATLTSERVLAGTTNQITLTDGGAGSTLTLSLPQDIHTGASPTFANATFSGRTSGRVAFYGTGGVMSDDADLEYFDTLSGGTTEYSLGISKTLSRTTSESTQSTLTQCTFTTTDTLTFSNDASIEMRSAANTYYVGGSLNSAGSITSTSYYGFKGELFTQGIHTLKGDSDTNVNYIGASGTVNIANVSVPTDGGDVNINTYGGYFSATGQITVTAPSNPVITHSGVIGIAAKGGGSSVQACRGGVFSATGATVNYGVLATGSTAAVMAVGNYLFNSANSYDLGDSTNIARAIYTKRIDLSTATTSSDGVIIGGGRFYQDTATSGSSGTLINPRVQFRTANLYINAPTHTSSTASEFALQTTKTFSPTANTSGRVWGFNYGVTLTSANNFTDATSAGVGVEGSVTNNCTGTVTALSGGIFFNTLGANSTTTRFAVLDLYGADVSGSGGVGATVTEAIGAIIRMGRSSGNTSVGNITSLFGIQHRASTWSGTGHMTNQYGMAYSSGGTMNAITANSQVRKYIEVPAMPNPGAFTSTVIYGIDFRGTSRLSRDGIRFAGDVELFAGASNRLDVGAGDSIRSDTSLISPLLRPGLTSGGSTQAMTVRGRDTGDDSTIGGAGTNLTVRAGDGATSKPTGAGGNLIFRCANGVGTGVMTFYKVDGTTKIQEFDNTGVAWWAKTPIAQPTTASGAAAFVANTSGIANDTATYGGYTIGQIAKALIDYGLLN